MDSFRSWYSRFGSLMLDARRRDVLPSDMASIDDECLMTLFLAFRHMGKNLDEQDLNHLELLNNSPSDACTNDPLDMLFGMFRTLINTHNHLKSLIITTPALDFPFTHLIFRASKGEILDIHPYLNRRNDFYPFQEAGRKVLGRIS